MRRRRPTEVGPTGAITYHCEIVPPTGLARVVVPRPRLSGAFPRRAEAEDAVGAMLPIEAVTVVGCVSRTVPAEQTGAGACTHPTENRLLRGPLSPAKTGGFEGGPRAQPQRPMQAASERPGRKGMAQTPWPASSPTDNPRSAGAAAGRDIRSLTATLPYSAKRCSKNCSMWCQERFAATGS